VFATLDMNKLRSRHKLAHGWVPIPCRTLLDVGCAFGQSTDALTACAFTVCGCDPNAEFVSSAQAQYPHLRFRCCSAEQLAYGLHTFRCVTLTDVLEHVEDEQRTLNEIYRVLRRDGVLIITTPHRGLFSFMDTTNYAWRLRTKWPKLFAWLFRMKHGREFKLEPGYATEHRHYRLEDFERMLNLSRFHRHYKIKAVHRGGCFIEPIAQNLFEVLSVLLGPKRAQWLLTPLNRLADWDYFNDYGSASYHIGIKIAKT